MKKRNMIRIAIAAFWLSGTLGILAKYRGDVRDILWINLTGFCAVLLFLSFLFTYILRRMRPKKEGFHKIEYLFPAFIALMSLYPLLMLGSLTADFIQGPVIKEAVIADKWDPRRGSDQAKTTDGETFDFASKELKLEIGRKYRLKVLDRAGIIISAEELPK
ncbi:hypothetical protein NYE69_17475 [Paenibacillus sp. FSL R5-0527]|uniref:hypothetical protein n=1 Tax=Paenibacillus sp. FSL R5-0527 TaxID=2975321 RepID=UPI000979CF77|nr:hypothetical protein BK140_28505 [Paenibacillus macerans]